MEVPDLLHLTAMVYEIKIKMDYLLKNLFEMF